MKRTDGQKRLSARLTHRKAFTLVELLVVIAIIGILFVVLISKVDFATEKAKATGVQTDFRSYQLAIETVARENAGLSTLVDDDASGEEKYAALEAALNKNLDPKLRVEIDADGKISTDAKDPWKEEYTGQYLAPDADGTVKDRGAIVMYCKGSNLKLGTTSETVNGVVNVTIESGKETEGADDYAISTIYTYVNGYGEIKTTTDGFSNDIGNIGDTINTPSGDGELDEDVIIEIWMVDSGEPINFTDLLRQDGATINTHLVNTLPETMIPLDMENGIMDAYILESTGVIYGNLNGTVMTLGQLMADGAAEGTAFDKGWSEDIYSETEDGFYCVRTSVTDKTEKVEVWIVSSGNPVNFADFIGAYGGIFLVHLVDALPENPTQCDEENLIFNAFVVRGTGIAYMNMGGEIMTMSSAFNIAQTDCGWSEDIYSETEDGFYCVRVVDVETNGGFYDADGNLLASWDTLVNDYGMKISVDNNWNGNITTASAPCNILTKYFPTTKKVVISDTVTKIGKYSFYECTSLTSVELGSGVKQIGGSAFHGCTGLTSVTIPDGVTSLGGFSECTGLTSILIPDSVTSIENCAFLDCSGLTGNLVIPNNVTSIGLRAFEGCYGLTGDLIIPEGVTSIGEYAFSECKGLTFISIPNSVTTIGSRAFSFCSNLSSVIIGSGVTDIDGSYFYNCDNLTSIVVDNASATYYSVNNCLIEKNTKTLALGCKSSILPTDGSITSIGYSAFYGCTGLTSIIIPDSVTEIGTYAFDHCKGLISVVISNSVTQIGSMAFANCSALETVTIKATTPPNLLGFGEIETFNYCDSLISIYIPAESVTAYKADTDWSIYSDKIQAIPIT